eukprot:7314981-Prymnesium_polylepis.1
MCVPLTVIVTWQFALAVVGMYVHVYDPSVLSITWASTEGPDPSRGLMFTSTTSPLSVGGDPD